MAVNESTNPRRLRRRDVLALAGGAALTVHRYAKGQAKMPTRSKTPPNILFLMTDQHRADCIGADGNAVIKTPHLDRIAREGALFQRAYTCTPSCTPARAALLTGLAPWRNGMLGYGQVAQKYPNEMPRMLREAGYYTTGIGKMHWHPQKALHGFHRTLVDESGRAEKKGFVSDYRRWFRREAPELDPDATGIGWNAYAAAHYALPQRLHPTRWTGDRAVEFLEKYERDEPFFLKVSFARPHSPYDAPQRFWKLYRQSDMPKPVVGAWAKMHAMKGKDPGANLSCFRGNLGVRTARKARHGYYANITFVDEQVGRMLDVLDQRGLLDNTLILMTADHGDMLGDHHLWRKTYAYEGSARIPMLVRWPKSLKAKRGVKLGQPVELRDILPTFLDAAGARFDAKRFDGASMLQLVRGKAKGWREYIDLEHSRCYWPGNQWTGLTDGRWKYVYFAYDGSQQLFDLKADPDELKDLSADPTRAKTLALWRQRMVAHLAERGETFVKDGDLAIRKDVTLYTPNYPGVVPRR